MSSQQSSLLARRPRGGLNQAIIANFKLVVRPSCYLRRYDETSGSTTESSGALSARGSGQGPQKTQIPLGDELIWEDIIALRRTVTKMDTLSCPICLDENPRAPVAGSCGHMFCWWCILRHLGSNCEVIGDLSSVEVILGKRAVHATCPVCSCILAAHELKPVSLEDLPKVPTASPSASDTAASTAHDEGDSGSINETPGQFHSVAELIGSIRSKGGSVSQIDRVAAAAASTEGDSPAITGRGLIIGINNKTGNKSSRNSKKKPVFTEKKPNGLPSTVHGEGMEACIIPSKPVRMEFCRVDRPSGCLAAQDSDSNPIDTFSARASEVPENVVYAGVELVAAHDGNAKYNTIQVASLEFLDSLWSKLQADVFEFANECAAEEKEATRELMQMQNAGVSYSPDALANLMHRWSGLAAAAGSWRPYAETIVSTLRLRRNFWFESLSCLSEKNVLLSKEAATTFPDDRSRRSFAYLQSRTGEVAFLHPLSTKLLLGYYKSYDRLPCKLQSRVVSVEGGRLTSSLRGKFPFLNHLPTGTPFWLCELDLRDHLPKNIASMCNLSDILKKRNQGRLNLLQRYKREQSQKRINAAEKEQQDSERTHYLSRAQLFAKYMGSSLPSESEMAAPPSSREQLTEDAFAVALSDRPEARQRNASSEHPSTTTQSRYVDKETGSKVASRAAKGWNMAQVASKNVGGGHFPSLSSRQRSDSNSSGHSFVSQTSNVSTQSRDIQPQSPSQSWSAVFKQEPQHSPPTNPVQDSDISTINTTWSDFFLNNATSTDQHSSEASSPGRVDSKLEQKEENTVIKIKGKKKFHSSNSQKITLFSTGRR
eukprot:gb/GECG01010931.1/.p1 GENE.gb/GECG01010931.1/~~gb/GECG01010931.1/.p1  ORF type:complete len:826 (+),score=101.31 gb/GECG01010931.1/:1-2478(+)